MQSEKLLEARKMAAAIARKCLSELVNESARICYDLRRIHALGLTAEHYFVQTFTPKLTDETAAIRAEIEECAVSEIILAAADKFERLMTGER